MEVKQDQKHISWYSFIILIISFLLGGSVYYLTPETCPEPARRTAVILTVAAIFWASELLELYVTSLLVILALTFTLSMPSDMLKTDNRGYTLFLSLFSDPIIMLFLGGFTLGKAFSKYGLDNYIAERIIFCFGRNPYSLLLGTMLTTMFIGFWISNTATAVIMFAIIQPFLRDSDIEVTFKKALVLCVPFAASIAGTGTPIASPPNAIALGLLEQKGIIITFLQWMIICIPLVLVRIIMASCVLKYIFPVNAFTIKNKSIHRDKINSQGKLVALIAFIIVTLFVTKSLHGIPEAITALLCMGAMTATRLLNQKDINSLDWNILILMWGGLALGLAVDLSGLGQWIIDRPIFNYKGIILVIILGLVTFILSSFISNTATAALMLPLALSIEGENKVILAITITIISSMGLALPIASPPNAIAYATGHLRSKDMYIAGIIVDLLSLAIIFCGFWIIIPMVVEKFKI